MSISLPPWIVLLLFPGGLFLLASGLVYQWADRKLVARFQNRVGPRFIQPLADLIKLLAKEEIIPRGVHKFLFQALPIIALASALTAAIYTPMLGLAPFFSFRGDLIIALYMLSVLTLCIGLAGANTVQSFSMIGAVRTLTQLFSYEAPFLLALLGPAIAAQTWQITKINEFASGNVWMILTQPIGFIIALIGLMGKLELPPFDAPEAETEIVAGALTEYSGRGYALFHLAKDVELVIGLVLVAAFYLGGLGNPLEFVLKTFALLLVMALFQTLFARLRIDQTVGLWWRVGAILGLLQLVAILVGRFVSPLIFGG
jgi:NADH-quinone oxidoreductase subunit H